MFDTISPTDLTAWLSIVAPALIAGVALVLLAAPLGCLVIWRNMSFFSDTLAHSALLGLAIASVLSLPLWFGMLSAAILMILLLWSLNDARIPNDALLAGLASTMLATGLIVISFVPELRASMMTFLFGDILAITKENVWLYVATCLIGCIALSHIWTQQLQTLTHEALAQVSGISVKKQRFYFMFILAAFTVMAIQAVGTLLISSLLILPALTARLRSQSPSQMVFYSLIYGFTGLFVGILLSIWLNVASGLCIVICLASMFLMRFIVSHLKNKSA